MFWYNHKIKVIVAASVYFVLSVLLCALFPASMTLRVIAYPPLLVLFLLFYVGLIAVPLSVLVIFLSFMVGGYTDSGWFVLILLILVVTGIVLGIGALLSYVGFVPPFSSTPFGPGNMWFFSSLLNSTK